MLTAATFENFRCLRRVTVRLGPLTALVGPNASGKSTVLAGLAPDLRLTVRDAFRHDGDLTIVRELHQDDGTQVRHELLRRWGEPWGTASLNYRRLRLDLARLREPNEVEAASALAEDGGNLVNAFASLSRKQQIALARQLSTLVPVIADVEARPLKAGQHQLLFQDAYSPDVWYEAAEVSDGTMLVLALLLLQHERAAASGPTLIAIEEPERGLHPYLLGQVVSFLRGLAHGEFGARPAQILLATHSAELLEHLRPEEVRFLTRSPEDGSVFVEEAPTSTPEWPQALREYQDSLGSLWLSGNLGGVPGI